MLRTSTHPTLGWSFNYSRYPNAGPTIYPHHTRHWTSSVLLLPPPPRLESLASLVLLFPPPPSPPPPSPSLKGYIYIYIYMRPPPPPRQSTHVLVSILNRRRDGREIIKTYNGIEIVSLSINAIHRLFALGKGRGRITTLLARQIQFSFAWPRLICVLIRGEGVIHTTYDLPDV